jgi:hypothetical protein
MESPYFICPTGGLASRLKVLLSWKMKAIADERHLVCYWPKTRLCNGLFSDCFEPIEGIEFVYEEPGPARHVDYEGDQSIGEIDIHGLKPRSELMSRINNNISFLKDYDAVHVRRTDFNAVANEKRIFVPDTEFFSFIDEGNGKTPIFLATDNMATQFAFSQKYKGLIRINRALRNTDTLRNSTLEDAVIDLFTCAAAKYFMGTKGSAFTDFIELLRSPDSPYSYESLTVKSLVIPDLAPVSAPAPAEETTEAAEETVASEEVNAAEETAAAEETVSEEATVVADVTAPVTAPSKKSKKNK